MYNYSIVTVRCVMLSIQMILFIVQFAVCEVLYALYIVAIVMHKKLSKRQPFGVCGLVLVLFLNFV